MAGSQKQISFLELSKLGKQTIVRHEQYAKEMYELLNIRHYLIEQIHKKKSTVNKHNGHYVPVSGRPCVVYNDILFLGLDCVDGLNDWSTVYKSDLENALANELNERDREYDVVHVYYGRDITKSTVLHPQAPINMWEWTLSSDIHVWSDEDETIIARYISKLYCFLTEKFDIIKKAGIFADCPQEWVDRVKKRFDTLQTPDDE